MPEYAIVVQHPPRERWGSVLNLALTARPVAERVRLAESLRHGGHSGFDGLLEARSRARHHTDAAALVVVYPGRTALVYQPRATEDASPVAIPLLRMAIDQFLSAHDVVVAQEVLPLDAVEDAARAKAAGYTIEVELEYLAADEGAFPTSTPSGQLTFEPYSPDHLNRLAAILDRTYLQTADCPELNGLRSTLDTITGYRATGEFRPDLWQFARHGGEDVGCLLVSRHDAALAELIYMGLVPEVRGRAWGARMIQQALWLTREARCQTLTLAVDARNAAALKAYERAKFLKFEARRVLLQDCRR